jgi:hypothetical protein
VTVGNADLNAFITRIMDCIAALMLRVIVRAIATLVITTRSPMLANEHEYPYCLADPALRRMTAIRVRAC